MIALYPLSLGEVGVTAFVGAARWYVAGLAHLPLCWDLCGDLARAALTRSGFLGAVRDPQKTYWRMMRTTKEDARP